MIPTILFIGALLALAVLGWLFWTAPIGFETDDHGWLSGTRADYPELFNSQQEATEAPVTGGAGSPQQAGTATLSDRDD